MFIQGTHGTFPLLVKADVWWYYLSFEVKCNHRCHLSRSCPVWNHWIFLIMRNSSECTLTDKTSLRKVSTSRWQYDTWIYNFPNQDSSIITKNKHPDSFNWQLEINNIIGWSYYIQSCIFNHYYYILLQIKHPYSNAKSDLAFLSQHRIEVCNFHPQSCDILPCSDFSCSNEFEKQREQKTWNEIL